MNDPIDRALGEALGLVVLILTAILFVWLLILLVVGVWAVRYLWGNPASAGEGVPLPPNRLFGAPPTVRWLAAYEYWLYRLEQVTWIEWSTTPGRLMIGCLIISLGIAGLIGGALWLLNPMAGMEMMGWSLLIGSGIGVFTGWQMAQPAKGWFDGGSPGKPLGTGEDEGIFLGEEID
jgi:hypothetical protein